MNINELCPSPEELKNNRELAERKNKEVDRKLKEIDSKLIIK